MRITFLALKRFKPFKLNDVELLELDMTSDVQNVIGSNGAGKSSLLRELNPRPATRSDYEEDGYKHIQLVHQGVDYRLESNFTSTNKPHSFVRNGDEELNQSGTAAIQEELVRNLLGYTKAVDDLCYGEQRLSAIRVGLRETYLLTVHPCQMKLLLDKHKNAERKLRGFRDNLSLLYERRTALVGEMLDEAVRYPLQAESTALANELALIVGAIHKLTNQKENVQAALARHPPVAPIRTVTEQQLARRRYPLYGDIPRTVPLDTHRSLIIGDISSCKARLDAGRRQIQALTVEIDKYEQYIRQCDAQGAIDVIEATLQTLRADIAALQGDILTQPFDLFDLDAVPAHISRLTDLVAVFIGYNAPIPAMREVQRMQLRFDHYARLLAGTEHAESMLQTRLAEIELRLREKVLDAVPDGCQTCVLFRQYNATIRTIRVEYEAADEELRRVQVRRALFARKVGARRERLATFSRIVPQMQQLEQYLTEHRFLFIPLRDLDLLTTLRQNPSLILIRLQSHYERSKNHYLRLKKQDELARRTADYERSKAPEAGGRQFLETMVNEKHAELTDLRTTYAALQKTLADKEDFLTLLTEYDNELQRLDREQRSFDQQEAVETLKFEHSLCDRYLAALEACKTRAVTRLSEIDRVLREQSGLAARHEEIAGNIRTIEGQQKELSEIELALSPSNGIPYRYMVQFINDLIAVANPFIGQVFSYPFAFIPLKEGEPLDYKFRMQVGDVVVPDIARCSEGQKDFADLAFRLARIILSKQTDYPIYLDEIDKAFDYFHRQQLLELLKTLTQEPRVVSQLFMINHNVSVYSGMREAEILVLNENNIVLPQVYNEHARFVRY